MYIKSTYDGLHVITGTTENVSIVNTVCSGLEAFLTLPVVNAFPLLQTTFCLQTCAGWLLRTNGMLDIRDACACLPQN